jgi:nucleotide-binding universal stress UspA family protein
MTEGLGILVLVGSIWLTIGLVLSIVMGRRGHNGFEWLVLGTLLGPLGIVLAVDARRHHEQLAPAVITSGGSPVSGPGPVDVLVGYDGSPESTAAMDAVVGLLGDRIGRLTVATVAPFGDVKLDERQARAGLGRLVGRIPGREPTLEVLHGHPSVALRQCATEAGYDLVVVGTRGAGITKTILGSAARELSRDCKVPVLLVGGSVGG